MNSEYQLLWTQQIQDLSQDEWDAMAKPLKTPFFEWDWLNTMATSLSTTAQSGWLPNHLTLLRSGRLVAAAPLYVKGHSYGEFVFDQQWAELADRMGINYYPKLLGMSPFTPAEGYQFLIDPGEDRALVTGILVEAIDQFCLKNRISGCSFLYVNPEWQAEIEALGWRSWLHHGYIWSNSGFKTFDDYLTSFNANQRRNIKRERKAVTQAGLSFKTLTGAAVTPDILAQVYAFYADTCDKFGWWGSKYLTEEFFIQLYDSFRDRIVIFAAYEDGDSDPMGLSFCLTKGDRLYGRYWGCRKEIDCLHFEACYYQPIAWAIENGIQSFDPGAGGQHKKRRGFPATPNRSLHRFYNPRFAQLFQTYIGQVNDMEAQEITAINEELPFTKREIAIDLEATSNIARTPPHPAE
jgi:uncharacterized protein